MVNVIERKDIVVLATEPTPDKLFRLNAKTGVKELRGFGKEYQYLIEHGYVFNSDTMQMIPK